jgi:predicted RNase H-like HicB family nuclease/DNA-binding phage protein
MTYYCTITKAGNKFISTFPDFPAVIALSSSHEKALVSAKETLESWLLRELSHGNVIPEPVNRKGNAIKISNDISIAIQLRNIRGDQTMRAVAEKIGFKYQAYQRLENPKGTSPTLKTLEKIAAAYGRELNVQFQ